MCLLLNMKQSVKKIQFYWNNSNKSLRYVQESLNSSDGFFHKIVRSENRSFSLKIQKFENGYFVSVTEGNDKIGSMIVSLATGPNPTTTTVIPSRSESLFLRLIAERISTRMKGIALVSTYIQKELESSTAKALMSEIMEMIENEWFKGVYFSSQKN